MPLKLVEGEVEVSNSTLPSDTDVCHKAQENEKREESTSDDGKSEGVLLKGEGIKRILRFTGGRRSRQHLLRDLPARIVRVVYLHVKSRCYRP
jgi:hypothetical protein